MCTLPRRNRQIYNFPGKTMDIPVRCWRKLNER